MLNKNETRLWKDQCSKVWLMIENRIKKSERLFVKSSQMIIPLKK